MAYSAEQIEDRERFAKLEYWKQWDCCVAYFARTGNFTALPAILFHVCCFVLHLLLLRHIMVACAGTVREGTDAYQDLALKNSCVLMYLAGFLAIPGGAGYTGPIYGELGRLTLYKFRLGVPVFRLPAFGGLATKLFGRTRQPLDLLHTAVTIAVSVQMLREPEPSPQLSVAFVSLYLAVQVLDFALAVGNYNMLYNWPMLWICSRYVFGPERFPILPAMQLQLLLVYLGCGFAKLGPWWEVAFGNEWTTPPPFAGRSILLNLFFQDATGMRTTKQQQPSQPSPQEASHKDGDRQATAYSYAFRATAFAKVSSRLTGLVELGAPLMLLFAHTLPTSEMQETCSTAGWLILSAMHVYIVGHLAHADVNCLNWLSAHLLFFCHRHLRFQGIARLFSDDTHPLALAFLVLDGGYSLWGHLNTDKAWQSQTYK